MKLKIISLALMLTFLISLVPVHSGENITADAIKNEIEGLAETQKIDIVDPGITPDKAGYGLKIALEKLRLGLTFNKQKRVELELELAKKRLAEARLMVNTNKIDALAKAREEHKRLIEKIKADLKTSGETESDLDKQSEIEVELEDQENKVEDLENVVLIKAEGLRDEQRQKLLDLIKEFRNQTLDVRIKVSENKQDIIKRLRAKGFNEEKLEEKEARLEANAERFAVHEINQSERMLELTSKLIEKAKDEKNITIGQETFDLKAKAEEKLNEARQTLTDKKYKESVELARESKKLSVLAIASIHGKSKGLIENKLKQLEDKQKLKLERELVRKVKEGRKEIKEKVKEELKKRKEKLEEKSGDDEEGSEDDKTSG